ncbi:MAG: hypothetical protein A2X36_07610 [Elusimicrobia bacterium GWA2_69_24]|nr:MAG: hypothetical protein A2X36_07610 [Elusimicrobia bacterium GWA2_69_24]HBL18027.1 hypothetical protein [Elusimicrobiota bacterium]
MTMNADAGVVMLTPNFHPYVGGAEKQALELSKALAAGGLPVVVATRRLPGLPAEDRVAGIPVRRLAAPGGGLLNAAGFMLSALWFLLRRRAEYGIIHVHLAGSPAVAACLAGRLFGKKVVIKVGGGRGIGEIALSSRTWAGRLKLGLLRAFRPQFISVTQDLADEMDEHGLGGCVRVIPNGVDTGRYRPASPEEKSGLRAELGWPEGLILLYVGRLAVEKRLVAFLEAFSRSCAQDPAGSPPVSIVLVGSGPEEPNLRLAVARFDLAGRVLLSPPTERIERCYRAADAFILPSISEGLSNALLEAMASGLPVLGTRVGGTREAVSDGVTGLLFDPPDDGALLRHLGALRADPALCSRLGAAARAQALERYSLAAVAERTRKLYNEL